MRGSWTVLILSLKLKPRLTQSQRIPAEVALKISVSFITNQLPSYKRERCDYFKLLSKITAEDQEEVTLRCEDWMLLKMLEAVIQTELDSINARK